jgi:hypothetical protein
MADGVAEVINLSACAKPQDKGAMCISVNCLLCAGCVQLANRAVAAANESVTWMPQLFRLHVHSWSQQSLSLLQTAFTCVPSLCSLYPSPHEYVVTLRKDLDVLVSGQVCYTWAWRTVSPLLAPQPSRHWRCHGEHSRQKPTEQSFNVQRMSVVSCCWSGTSQDYTLCVQLTRVCIHVAT